MLLRYSQRASVQPLHNLQHAQAALLQRPVWLFFFLFTRILRFLLFFPPSLPRIKKNKLLLNMQVNGNGCEDSLSRYPIVSARTPGVTPASTAASYTLPGTPTLLEEHSAIKSESCTPSHFAVWVNMPVNRGLRFIFVASLCLVGLESHPKCGLTLF